MEMKQLKYNIFDDGAIVKGVALTKILPCITTAARIRLMMQLDSELDGKVISRLVSKFPPGNVNYIKKKKILTLISANVLSQFSLQEGSA